MKKILFKLLFTEDERVYLITALFRAGDKANKSNYPEGNDYKNKCQKMAMDLSIL